jgi:8-oxo-dGTP pyrophosphatase MutT (NUDIX family)/GTP:adenosylcobinamide-phosphate guanylyltransferase
MTTAVIMAGGRGERMRTSTGRDVPKPLVEVRGVSLLERNLTMLLMAGVRDIVVACPAREAAIATYVGTRGRALAGAVGAAVQPLIETRPLGTIGAAAELAARGDDVLVINADNLLGFDVTALTTHHRATRAALTVATHEEPFQIPFGEVVVDGPHVAAYREKPSFSVRVSSGTYVLGRAALARLTPGERADAPGLVDALLSRGEPVAHFDHEGLWIDVNDAAALGRAEKLLGERAAEFERWRRAPDVTVAGVVLRAGDEVLLEYRPETARCYPGVWDTPGGKLEPGESPAEALAREVREELGLELRDAAPVAAFDDLDPASGKVFRHHVFVADVERRAAAARQGQVLAWMPLDGRARLAPLSPVVPRSLAALGVRP